MDPSEKETKYYSQSSILNNVAPKPSPKITYDTILNSMNMYVDNGILRLGVDKKKLEGLSANNNQNASNVPNYKQDPNYNQSPNYKQDIKRVELKNVEPVDPSVKNSWIYNKYFKDYKGDTGAAQEEIPLTPEELREKKIRDYIEYVNARKRAAQVKSTKMLFSNNSVQQIDINTSQNNAKLNRLFRF